jgi:parallel beta-helix repeat protein
VGGQANLEVGTMESSRRLGAAALSMFLLVGIAVATPAAAGHLNCGHIVTVSTTLDADLFCPTGDGLIVEGSGIVLNLNGHTVRGELERRTVSQPGAIGDNGEVGAPYTVRFARGQFAGIRVRGNRNAVMGPGTVKNFAAGIVVEGGANNSVNGLTVEENLGPPGTSDLGDGIMLFDSRGNSISGNTVRDNGPFDGVALLGSSGRNVIQGNRIQGNAQPEICPEFDLFRFSVSGGGIVHTCGPTHPSFKPFTFFTQQIHGIKLEGVVLGAPFENRLSGNVITGNGNTGVFIPSTCPDFGPNAQCQGESIRDNIVNGNQVHRNGFGYPTGRRAATVFEGPSNGGSGIIMMIGGPNPPIRQTVYGNTVNDNAKHGIAVLAHRPGNPVTVSRIYANTALRNNAIPDGGPAFNGMDGNAFVNPGSPCDSNVWAGNNFGSSPADIGGPIPSNNLTNHPCVGPML